MLNSGFFFCYFATNVGTEACVISNYTIIHLDVQGKNVGVTDMKIHLTRVIARLPRNHSDRYIRSQCECTCQFLCSPVVALLLALLSML